jgi:hypothetical protein
MSEETEPDGIDAPFDAPPLADTADPGYAERIVGLRNVAEPPVRVRFVQLPDRTGEMYNTILGLKVPTIEPGGFALVVDRFKHLAHLDAEREHWTAWADTIGAATVLLYPGELDIYDVLEQ